MQVGIKVVWGWGNISRSRAEDRHGLYMGGDKGRELGVQGKSAQATISFHQRVHEIGTATCLPGMSPARAGGSGGSAHHSLPVPPPFGHPPHDWVDPGRPYPVAGHCRDGDEESCSGGSQRGGGIVGDGSRSNKVCPPT